VRALILSLALTIGCGEAPMQPREPTPGVPHFTIATYNIEADKFADEPTIRAIGDLGVDILCLQEVGEEWERVLRARYADRYPYMLFFAQGSGGLGFMSIFPLEDHKFMPGPLMHPAWHVRAGTPAGWVELLNVHLAAPQGSGVANLQSIAALSDNHENEIVSFRSGASEAVPTIVLGDFNEQVDGAAVHLLEQAGFRNALPLFRPGQWTSRHPSPGNQFTQTLDHIMFDRAFEPLNAYVKVIGNSDHIPVIAALEVPHH
jgi:endonuclease/exonuclease/phosphatase family metal-dependent hydrolase